MGAQISPAIILRIKEFGESDLLIGFFTSDKGRLKGVAKGARRSRRRFSNCLDLFCLTNLEYESKRKGELYFIHSCKLVHAFPEVRSDFFSLTLASYMTELTETLFPLAVEDEKMFELLKESFYAINKGTRRDVLRIFFEARAMALGGYGIDLGNCCRCGRPYTGGGDAVFEPQRGGIACLNCRQESSTTPLLSPGSVRSLRVMQSFGLESLEATDLTDEMVSGIKVVNRLHIDYRIGQRLKTAQYLE
ncbi:MAG: DNA repair protein RecO [Pseudomonadota bacterium]